VTLIHVRIVPVVLLRSFSCMGDGRWVSDRIAHEAHSVEQSARSNVWRALLIIFGIVLVC
jgi:hypothetical protein